MKIHKPKLSNIIFIFILALLVIPQTRKPIQVFLNRGLALFSPSVVDKEDRVKLDNYNWNLMDENNVQFDFNKARGKVVVINFWATWCPPCIAEMDSLEELFAKFSKNQEVEFLFVTSDPLEKIKVFKEKENYTFPVYRQISREPQVFNVSSIPRTFILDKEGNIVVDKTGASNWNSEKVESLIRGLMNQ